MLGIAKMYYGLLPRQVIISFLTQGTFLVTQAFTKALLESSKETKEGTGAVVNIASISGKTGKRGLTHYAGTKGGVISLTKSCASELAR